jgi:UDP-glucose:(glucosyl)LPS alpha-1,2-glucosyltransferase
MTRTAQTTPLIAIVLPPREGAGPGRAGAVYLIARQFAETPGFRALVIGGPQDTEPPPPFQQIRPPWWHPGSINTRFAYAVARSLRTLNPALVPALIEVHNRADVALALARRLPDIPISLFLHNDPQAMRGARTPADRARLLDRFARVVLVSDYLRALLLEGIASHPRQPPVVIHNCIDLAAIPAAGPRERLILFVGRVVPDKGTDSFVAACAAALPRLPGWRAAIIGADRFRADSPETAFTRRVRAAAEPAGVRLLGYQQRTPTLEAMARAAIVVMPSRWAEPFGLTALEAMACGAALICSARGGLPEVAGDAALYADPDNPAEIAEAIVALARDDPRRAALAAAGRERARRFDRPLAQAQVAALRHEILSAGD